MSSFDSVAHKGIARECCVVLDEATSDIKYAGPISMAEKHIVERTLLLLHPEDFEKLKVVVGKGKH